MKRIIIASLNILLALLVTSCRKDDINGSSKNLILGSYITLDSLINKNLDYTSATATVAIKVGEYGSPVKGVDVYLAKGDDAEDSTGWVFIKHYDFSDGLIMSVSTSELTEALAPDTIAPGNVYQLRNVVLTKDGRKFASYNTPETYNSFPAYNMAIKWTATAVCPYTTNEDMAGAYTVVSDPNWKDWAGGETVIINAGAKPNELDLSNVWPNPDYGTSLGPWYVDIDPKTGEATVPAKQNIGDYGYKLTVDATPGTGYVFSCTGLITLSIPLYAVGYGSQGAAKLVLKKQ